MLSRQTKKILKAIAKQQARHGIESGDICPRCGRPAMSANEKNPIEDFDILVCNQCAMDIALGEITGEDLSYDKWAAVGNAHIDPNGEWAPDETPVKREVLPRFQEGDRVCDTRSDWPCTVTGILSHGLYFARPDGQHTEELILNDKETTYEMDPDLPSYVNMLKDRLPVGSLLRIEKIRSTPGVVQSGEIGKIVAISNSGKVDLEMLTSKETISIFPDTDFFSLLGDKVPIKNNTIEFADDIKIEL